jgi:hypothetical protein
MAKINIVAQSKMRARDYDDAPVKVRKLSTKALEQYKEKMREHREDQIQEDKEYDERNYYRGSRWQFVERMGGNYFCPLFHAAREQFPQKFVGVHGMPSVEEGITCMRGECPHYRTAEVDDCNYWAYCNFDQEEEIDAAVIFWIAYFLDAQLEEEHWFPEWHCKEKHLHTQLIRDNASAVRKFMSRMGSRYSTFKPKEKIIEEIVYLKENENE